MDVNLIAGYFKFMIMRHILLGKINWAIVLSIHTNVVLANTCLQVPNQVAAPSNGKIYQSHLTSVSPKQPSIIDFSSPERYILSVSRPGDKIGKHAETNPPISIKVSLKDAISGELREHCRIENITLPDPFRKLQYFVYSPDAEAKDWRAEIIEYSTEIVNSQRADSLSLEIRKFPNIQLEYSDAYGGADTVNLDCNANLDPAVTLPITEQFQKMGEIGPDSKSITTYIRSTGPLLIDLEKDFDDSKPEPVRDPSFPPTLLKLAEIRVAVKTDTPDKFSSNCSPFLGTFNNRPQGQYLIRATHKFNNGSTLIWRIEMQSPKNAKFRTRFSLRYPSDGDPNMPSYFPSEFVCASPNPTRGVTRLYNDKAFAGATLLSVTINDPELLLSNSAREAITQHLLIGMTLWRPVCFLCTPDQLVIANVEGKRYVLDVLIQALNDFYSGNLPTSSFQTPSNIGRNYYTILSAIDARHQPRATPKSVQYLEIKDSTPGLLQLCNDNFEQLPVPLQRIRLAWGCEGETAKAQMSNVKASTQLSFITNPLDGCSSADNTVACESSAFKIEFNAKDYRFLTHSEGKFLVGRGTRSVDLLHVLTHEIGHWIGIGHLSEPGSIMNETLAESRCIDTAATHAVNILASGGIFPIKTPKALLFENPKDLEQK